MYDNDIWRDPARITEHSARVQIMNSALAIVVFFRKSNLEVVRNATTLDSDQISPVLRSFSISGNFLEDARRQTNV